MKSAQLEITLKPPQNFHQVKTSSLVVISENFSLIGSTFPVPQFLPKYIPPIPLPDEYRGQKSIFFQ